MVNDSPKKPALNYFLIQSDYQDYSRVDGNYQKVLLLLTGSNCNASSLTENLSPRFLPISCQTKAKNKYLNWKVSNEYLSLLANHDGWCGGGVDSWKHNQAEITNNIYSIKFNYQRYFIYTILFIDVFLSLPLPSKSIP